MVDHGLLRSPSSQVTLLLLRLWSLLLGPRLER